MSVGKQAGILKDPYDLTILSTIMKSYGMILLTNREGRNLFKL